MIQEGQQSSTTTPYHGPLLDYLWEWLSRSIGIITLPTQRTHNSLQILQNDHAFALVYPRKMGNLMIPDLLSQKYQKQRPKQVAQFCFQQHEQFQRCSKLLKNAALENSYCTHRIQGMVYLLIHLLLPYKINNSCRYTYSIPMGSVMGYFFLPS